MFDKTRDARINEILSSLEFPHRAGSLDTISWRLPIRCSCAFCGYESIRRDDKVYLLVPEDPRVIMAIKASCVANYFDADGKLFKRKQLPIGYEGIRNN